MRTMIVRDEFHIFEGPLVDQYGKTRILEGDMASRDHVVNMDWFVDNVEGEIPIIAKEDIHDPLTKLYNIN
jgi:basic membrane protein A